MTNISFCIKYEWNKKMNVYFVNVFLMTCLESSLTLAFVINKIYYNIVIHFEARRYGRAILMYNKANGLFAAFYTKNAVFVCFSFI